jgi:mannitol-1-/sugar-/sorbitol-6-/2-deoxyglucose-6-phosphatase
VSAPRQDPGSAADPDRVRRPQSGALERPFRALLWDMDGLLVDSEPLWFRVERDFAARRGGDFTEEHARENIGKGIRNTVRFMHELFGFPVDLDRDVDELIADFLARAGELTLKPGAAELLERTRGVHGLALASSSHRRLVYRSLDQFGIRHVFSAVVSGEDAPRPKPAPDLFLRAAELLGVPIGECVVLEDSIAGVTAGRAAGAIVIAVPEGPLEGRPFHEIADVVVTDLFEAARWLELSSPA